MEERSPRRTPGRSVSPLVGTWTRDGALAAGGALAGVIGKAPKVQSEQDTYTTPDASTLRIAEGSSHREYQFRVSGGKLFLTPSGAGEAAVFTKAAATS
jgi:hypothetical protein